MWRVFVSIAATTFVPPSTDRRARVEPQPQVRHRGRRGQPEVDAVRVPVDGVQGVHEGGAVRADVERVDPAAARPAHPRQRHPRHRLRPIAPVEDDLRPEPSPPEVEGADVVARHDARSHRLVLDEVERAAVRGERVVRERAVELDEATELERGAVQDGIDGGRPSLPGEHERPPVVRDPLADAFVGRHRNGEGARDPGGAQPAPVPPHRHRRAIRMRDGRVHDVRTGREDRVRRPRASGPGGERGTCCDSAGNDDQEECAHAAYTARGRERSASAWSRGASSCRSRRCALRP